MVIRVKMDSANSNSPAPMDDGGITPDHVQPFMLDSSQLRGRIVRLPTVIDTILKKHAYPQPVAQLLAEALCLTTLLAGMLKFDGIFTLQIKANGALKSLVCDMTSDGTLRGYASYFDDIVATMADANFRMLTAGGYLAFTVDQAHTTERYQGIVALDGETLTACVRDYFTQSEQIKTGFVTFVDTDANGHCSGGAIMLQELAREGGIALMTATASEDDWQRSMVLLHTAQSGEMLNQALPLNTLLFRLFHEEGVRVFSPIPVQFGCRCNADKIALVINGLDDAEKKDLADADGTIPVTCDFCDTIYHFPIGDTP